MEPPVFRVSEELRFLRHRSMIRVVHRMKPFYRAYLWQGYEKREALYMAYRDALPKKYLSKVLSLGAEVFYKDLEVCIREIADWLNGTIATIGQSGELEQPNLVANESDPASLFEIACVEEGYEWRMMTDARRNFAAALQLLKIKTIDPETKVYADLRRIDSLSYERLFAPKEDDTVVVIAELDPSDCSRAIEGSERIFRGSEQPTGVDSRFNSLNVLRRVLTRGIRQYPQKVHETFAKIEADAYEKEMREQGKLVLRRPFYCRWTRSFDGKRYMVYAIDRRKTALSALLKLERGRGMTDRRGWKYVVIAVEEHGSFRVASFKDAKEFNLLTRQVLWKEELVCVQEEVDRAPSFPVGVLNLRKTAQNPNRSKHYVDVKTRGWFARDEQDGRKFFGGAEQIVMALNQYLRAEYSTGEENHKRYREKQLIKSLVPIWWWYLYPERQPPLLGFYEDLADYVNGTVPGLAQLLSNRPDARFF